MTNLLYFQYDETPLRSRVPVTICFTGQVVTTKTILPKVSNHNKPCKVKTHLSIGFVIPDRQESNKRIYTDKGKEGRIILVVISPWLVAQTGRVRPSGRGHRFKSYLTTFFCVDSQISNNLVINNVRSRINQCDVRVIRFGQPTRIVKWCWIQLITILNHRSDVTPIPDITGLYVIMTLNNGETL
ncbi:hypothetical protein KAR91_46495 [Candidatus Pacearchaeota archaeon]|nr:hypothetical protein [Candidatus Pacearchaeota archaeon]